MANQKLPQGWDNERVQRLAKTYETLSEDVQTAEDEAAVQNQGDQSVISVPTSLLPTIRQLLAEQELS